ncbi:MAG: hypothetical protein Q8T04_06825 [Bacteroidota bacterium]|nr:hypothetical protein [Bacteroidota bacterium]
MKEIHDSWEFMNPNENEKYEDFRFEEYYKRVIKNEKLKHIPKIIFEQWIYYLHNEYNTLQNYAWINYENIEFDICEWDFTELTIINIIEDFREHVKNRSQYTDFDQFCCTDEDIDHWNEKGTWRIPPIILDVKSLNSKIPEWSELIPPYQLVEGHSRLGYLYSMKRLTELNKGKISLKHWIYLMKGKSTKD